MGLAYGIVGSQSHLDDAVGRGALFSKDLDIDDQNMTLIQPFGLPRGSVFLRQRLSIVEHRTRKRMDGLEATTVRKFFDIQKRGRDLVDLIVFVQVQKD
jgi:hypothetical protein